MCNCLMYSSMFTIYLASMYIRFKPDPSKTLNSVARCLQCTMSLQDEKMKGHCKRSLGFIILLLELFYLVAPWSRYQKMYTKAFNGMCQLFCLRFRVSMPRKQSNIETRKESNNCIIGINIIKLARARACNAHGASKRLRDNQRAREIQRASETSQRVSQSQRASEHVNSGFRSMQKQ